MATVPARERRRPAPLRQPGRIVIVTDRFHFTVPASAQTHAGFRAWVTSGGCPERVRCAFLAGEVILDLSNEELETQVAVKGEITCVLARLVRDQKLGKFYGDGVLFSNVQARMSNNPYAVFLSRNALQSGLVTFVPTKGAGHQPIELSGTPDWVLEVVSRSSVSKDTQRLRAAYHRAGIPEFWLIDARGEEIAFHVLHHRKSGYVTAPVKDGWQRSRVFGRWFRLERARDEFDLWEYTLYVRDE
jgi:hypothetical protein